MSPCFGDSLPPRFPANSRAASGPGEAHDAVRHQSVVDDDVGAAQRVQRVQRQEAGIARPAAAKPHGAGREVRQGAGGSEGGERIGHGRQCVFLCAGEAAAYMIGR